MFGAIWTTADFKGKNINMINLSYSGSSIKSKYYFFGEKDHDWSVINTLVDELYTKLTILC